MVSNEEIIDTRVSELNDTESYATESDATESDATESDATESTEVYVTEIRKTEESTKTIDTESRDVPATEIRKVEEEHKETDPINTESIIIGLLKLSIYNPGEKISIKLPRNIKELLGKLMDGENPLFDKIETSLFNIIKDDAINTNDVPDFIAILIVIYETIYNNKSPIIKKDDLADTAGIVIKFIIDVLVTENVIKINDDNKEKFLFDVNRLVDTCVTLVKLSKSVKTPGCIERLFR